MGILTKGTKELLINFAAKYPLIFTKPGTGPDANKEVAATAADATKVRIKGFADSIVLAGVTGSLIAERAQPVKLNVITVDPAQAAQITTSGANAAGAPLTLLLEIHSTNFLPEYHNGSARYFRTRTFNFAVPANVTPAQVLALLNEQMAGISTLFPEADNSTNVEFTSSVDGNGKLTITTPDPTLTLVLKVNDLDVVSRSIVTKLAPVTVQAAYEGRGLFDTLRGGRLQTEGTNDPYTLGGFDSLPQEGAQYSSVSFATLTDRPDLMNSNAAADAPVSTVNKFRLLVAEGAANEPYIQDLVNFLARSGAGVSKSYATKDGDGKTKAQFILNADA